MQQLRMLPRRDLPSRDAVTLTGGPGHWHLASYLLLGRLAFSHFRIRITYYQADDATPEAKGKNHKHHHHGQRKRWRGEGAGAAR